MKHSATFGSLLTPEASISSSQETKFNQLEKIEWYFVPLWTISTMPITGVRYLSMRLVLPLQAIEPTVEFHLVSTYAETNEAQTWGRRSTHHMAGIATIS